MKIRRARLSFWVALVWVAAILLPVALALVVARPGTALAQTKQYHMDRYDSDITVNTDGSLDVQETLTYVFTSGTFRRGLREIPTDKLDDITNIRVAEQRGALFTNYQQTAFDPDDSTSGASQTYGIENDGSTLRLRWIYGNTSNAQRTFRITYHVSGAVRVYPDRDEFDWYAVPPRWGASINDSRVSVTFPQGSDSSGWKLASWPTDTEVSNQGNKIVWTANGGLGSGLEVGAQLPKGILSANRPAWQDRVDQEEKDREAERLRQADYDKNVRPLVDLGFFAGGIILLVLGILWMLMRWYTKGRDKVVKLPTDYLTEPPSDLPPGLVGTLLDESADVRDVIATVVDMGKKGNLTIAETQGAGLLGLGGKDFQYTQTGNATQHKFEELVQDALFSSGSTVSLSDLKNKFYTKLPPIYSEMYKSLVDLKYLPENPASVRSRSFGLGCGVLVLGLLVVGLWVAIGATFSYMMLIPGLALGATGIAGLALAGAMPRKTDFGSEEAEKWRAFKRYLQQIQRYTNVQEASDRFQKYLPYAVAMGVDQEFTRQFNSVPSAMPVWYVPFGYYPYGYGGTTAGSSAGGMTGGGVSGGGFDPGGAMQGMSDSLGGAMQGLSDSFTNMVNSASNILTSAPSSSSSGGGGGGWGGGGGSFGGGGGGGGGGGAD